MSPWRGAPGGEVPAAASVRWADRLRRRIPALDGLRGIAVLLVLVLHLWRPEKSTLIGLAVGRLTRLGWVGVDLFFVLSGFLITGILLETRGRPGALRSFFARRVLRIFPLYYLFLLATLAAIPLFAQARGIAHYPGYGYAEDAGAWPWFAAYASNVWMALRGDFPAGYANSLTWSLAVEEQFYLIWPFVVLTCPPRLLTRVLAGMIAAAAALRLGLALAGAPWIATFVLTPCRIDTLAAGGLLAAHARSPAFDPERWRRLGWWGLACLPAGLGWLLAAGDAARETAAFQAVGYSLLAFGWAGLLSLVLVSPHGRLARWLECRPLRSLGKYSYGLYLFHLPAFVVVYPLVYRRVLALTGHPLAERFFWLLAGIAGSWFLAVALFHLYEAPFLRLKGRFPEGGMPAPRRTEVPYAAP